MFDSGMGSSAGIAAMALISGHQVESIVAAGLAGALLGFLVYNFPPAKIFLGDTGRMFIGLLLGALSLRCALKEATATSLLVPVTILSIRFLIRSWRFETEANRTKHFCSGPWASAPQLAPPRILEPRSGYRCDFVIQYCCLGAFLGMHWKNDWIAFASMGIALGGLVVGKLFGHKELKLLGTRAMTFGVPSSKFVEDQVIRYSLRWFDCKDTSLGDNLGAFIEFAEKHDLCKISMDLNVPWLHEGFHASWQKHQLPELTDRWTRLPIVADGRVFGRFEVIGKSMMPRYSRHWPLSPS